MNDKVFVVTIISMIVLVTLVFFFFPLFSICHRAVKDNTNQQDNNVNSELDDLENVSDDVVLVAQQQKLRF
ncbi:hypothetical protein ECHHL_0208 [Ehrlichia chaffeensis str. Heartland]|nr:hypothetical protein [Ehrlichia chaffeensis]AHX03374.1 hypothetical protein ECHHL_0208 [Ehrlichia chaffeensis str. Heartland]AHX05905.1 hypothetical protein ECHJAX_0849 [Ehrlichia chaffeensis str. Jax]AHX06897.1 hypothetical protein ECHLIB_0853 [Ehrlichia chaffeensis str. Liberty]AHX07238.1 hypothetical protein ECHOSC_0216 [Ehrlichia chaffeensis str. Osceola]AHX08087.1 hypothetical protein ECHSTV_0839 [Ehrlichia chaffeensis str. Saint Vincent]